MFNMFRNTKHKIHNARVIKTKVKTTIMHNKDEKITAIQKYI